MLSNVPLFNESALMNIEIDRRSGFCHGVTTAIKKAETELQGKERLYCLGDIVHNDREVERLRLAGLETIEHNSFSQLHDAKVLLPPPAPFPLLRPTEPAPYSDSRLLFKKKKHKTKASASLII